MLWQFVIVVMFLLTLGVLLREQRKFRDFPTLFLMLAIWGRFFVAFLHQYSLQPVLPGVSGLALYTLFVIVAGMLLVPPRLLTIKYMWAFYALFIVIFISGVGNGEYRGIFMDLSRWAFFVVITLLSLRAIETIGLQRVVRLYLIVFLPPLLLQLLGFVAGIQAVGPDGAVTYIGGYFTDSAFWKILFGLVCVSALLQTRRDVLPLLFVLAAFVGIYLTSHRTAMMSTLPVVALLGISVVGHVRPAVLRVMLFVALAAMILPTVPLLLNSIPDRYAVVFDFASNLDLAFADPNSLTDEQQRLGTGRIGIWSSLLYEWRTGSTFNHLLGFGPETAWVAPHNEFVGFLFQFGIIGLVAFVIILVVQFVLALRVQDRILGLRVLACTTGFLVTCFTTNQVWAIEGLMALAIICAVTWGALEQRQERTTATSAAEDPGKLGARWQSKGQATATRSTAIPARAGTGLREAATRFGGGMSTR